MQKVLCVWLAVVAVLLLVMAALGYRPHDMRFTDEFANAVDKLSVIQDKLIVPVRKIFEPDDSSMVDPVSGTSVKIRSRSPALIGDKLYPIKRELKSDLWYRKVDLSDDAFKCLSVTGMLQKNGITDPLRWLVFDVNGNLVQYLYRPVGFFKAMEDHTDDGVIISAKWTLDNTLIMQYVNQDQQIVYVTLPIYPEGTVHG